MFVVDRQVPVIIIGISLWEDVDKIKPNQIFNSMLITYSLANIIYSKSINWYWNVKNIELVAQELDKFLPIVNCKWHWRFHRDMADDDVQKPKPYYGDAF